MTTIGERHEELSSVGSSAEKQSLEPRTPIRTGAGVGEKEMQRNRHLRKAGLYKEVAGPASCICGHLYKQKKEAQNGPLNRPRETIGLNAPSRQLSKNVA